MPKTDRGDLQSAGIRDHADLSVAQQELAGRLRAWRERLTPAEAGLPADEHLDALIRDLRDLSPRFAELWEGHPVARAPARHQTFVHPEIGETVDCDVLAV